MATKTQSRNASARTKRNTGANTRTRKSAGARTNGTAKSGKAKRKSGWACFLGIVATLAVIAGTVLLILEFCTAYKPSNGFKKVVPDTEQTEQLPDDKSNGGEELPAGGEEKKPEENGGQGGTETPETPAGGEEETA